MPEDIVKDTLPETQEQVQETLNESQDTIREMLAVLKEQGKHLTTITEHLLKLHLKEAVEDVIEEPEIVAGEAVDVAKQGAETGVSALKVPPDVVQDTLEDTDKGLKEITPRKKTLFKKR